MKKSELKQLIKEQISMMGIVGLQAIGSPFMSQTQEVIKEDENKKLVPTDFEGAIIKSIYFNSHRFLKDPVSGHFRKDEGWTIETDRGVFSIDKQLNFSAEI